MLSIKAYIGKSKLNSEKKLDISHPDGTSKVSCKSDYSKVPDYNGGL